MPSFHARHLLPLAILLAACALVYWPGLYGGFILDDFNNIVSNPRVQIKTLDAESLWRAAGGYAPEGAYGRPLATLSLGLNYWIGGNDAFSYKLVNLALHGLNAWLVFLLVVRLAAGAGADADANLLRKAAIVIALLWALHPIQVSTVLYVVQRMEILATTFVLLGLLAYWEWRTRQQNGRAGARYLVAALAMMLLGMLSKETAALLPAFTLALEATILGFRSSSPGQVRALRLGYAAGILVALAVFAALLAPGALAPEAYSNRDFTAYERVLTQMRVLPMYLGHILLPSPSGMTFYYDNFEPSRGLLSPWTTAAGIALLTALAAAAWFGRRAMPLASLGIFWFYAGHLLTSNVFNLELVFEHRNYFPLLGVLLVLLALALRLLPAVTPIMQAGIVSIVLLGSGGLSLLRTATWGDELLLATDLAARNPNSPRAANELATLYAGIANSDARSPFFQRSLDEFDRASRLPGSSPLPEQGLILISAAAGVPAKNEWWDRLDDKIATRPIGPQEVMALTGLMQQQANGMPVDTERLGHSFGLLIERQAWPARMYVMYGNFLIRTGQDETLSGQMFAEAVSAAPSDLDYARRLLGVLVEDGHQAQALMVLERMKQLGMPTGTEK